MQDKKIARINLLADIAEAVLVEGLTQQQAAERFGLSRPSISRLLTEAREEGIVHIEIRRMHAENEEVARRLMQRFGPATVYVAGVTAQDGRQAQQSYFRYAAERVEALLEPGDLVGITLGTTLGGLVDRLAESGLHGISLVQLCGSIGAADDFLDSHALVARLSQALHASCLYLHAPYAVESREMRDMLNHNPSNALCIEQGRKVGVALVGLGMVGARQSSLHRGGHVSSQTIAAFGKAGAVGDVAGFYVDALGRPVDTGKAGFWRTGIGFEDFARIPRRVGFAFGASKAPIIAAALRGRLITHLVTDQELARQVLDMA
ncbi:sugar-binding domain-containing protein [Nitratireductor sp. StC3]|uniref:sugar-binding transcriptional regulator n=1 Tax=Nitratireductor sp. StC3 TaxID=2126741 RepID=UPI000D0DC50C|nr:sugar-binding domain-containing protein [Nitratireductor sp. StC3]PSM16789.1 hypothetical protein C7T96_19145 [Nitratireductor sp. StC3]